MLPENPQKNVFFEKGAFGKYDMRFHSVVDVFCGMVRFSVWCVYAYMYFACLCVCGAGFGWLDGTHLGVPMHKVGGQRSDPRHSVNACRNMCVCSSRTFVLQK